MLDIVHHSIYDFSAGFTRRFENNHKSKLYASKAKQLVKFFIVNIGVMKHCSDYTSVLKLHKIVLYFHMYLFAIKNIQAKQEEILRQKWLL